MSTFPLSTAKGLIVQCYDLLDEGLSDIFYPTESCYKPIVLWGTLNKINPRSFIVHFIRNTTNRHSIQASCTVGRVRPNKENQPWQIAAKLTISFGVNTTDVVNLRFCMTFSAISAEIYRGKLCVNELSKQYNLHTFSLKIVVLYCLKSLENVVGFERLTLRLFVTLSSVVCYWKSSPCYAHIITLNLYVNHLCLTDDQ